MLRCSFPHKMSQYQIAGNHRAVSVAFICAADQPEDAPLHKFIGPIMLLIALEKLHTS